MAHTPSRYDPCTTGTDGASLGARPCGGSDVEASPRQSCAARRLSVSNPWATHVGTIRSSPGPSPAHGVVQPGRVVVRGARAPTAPTAYGQNRAAYAPPAIVPARGHRLLRPSPACGMREAARTSCCASRQERCRAKVDASAAGESPVSSLAPLVSRGSGETRGVLGEERPACLCKSTSCATAW